MKVVNTLVKVLTALAAVAGAIYVIATYGEQIVAWCKKTLASLPKCPCTDCECECDCECDGECDCEGECKCECKCEAEEAVEEPAEEVVEEVVVEEPVEEAPAAKEPTEEAVVADDEDFVG